MTRPPRLNLRPITQRAAREFVDSHHRHNSAPLGSIFQVALEDEAGDIVAVAIAGRPVARGLDDGRTLEVLRVCTLGHPNACSMLYGACARAGKALGYDKIITYTLQVEQGASLRAAGWVQEQLLPDRAGWDTPSRRRLADPSPRGSKIRWVAA